MISNKDILIFSDDWGRFPSTLQHIAKRLLNQNRIIWVGSLGLRKPRLSFSDLRRVFEKVRSSLNKSAINTSEPEPILLNPLVLPFHDIGLIRRLNKFLLLKKLRNKINSENFNDFVILTSSPVSALVLGKLGEISSHYFCLDDYTKFEGAFESIKLFEEMLMKTVDSSFSISETLVRSRTPLAGKSYFLPQGVDVDHFRKGQIEKSPLPKFDKPVIGFFGMLSEWVNIKLFTEAAKKYPGYIFLIVGPAVVSIEEFKKFDNIYYTGPVSYDELPNYAKHFTVGLIPFEINELTVAVNPLKLMEYLSIGIPVVSTNMPEVKKFEELVFIAESDSDFINKIELAVADNKNERNQLRESKSDEYSWDNLTEYICGKIFNA